MHILTLAMCCSQVIMGLPYDQKVDVWSLGCILAELSSGYVLFQVCALVKALCVMTPCLGYMWAGSLRCLGWSV